MRLPTLEENEQIAFTHIKTSPSKAISTVTKILPPSVLNCRQR